jgi:hypothetical protein
MIPPQALAIGGALAIAAGFLAGWTVRDWKADSDALAAVKKTDLLRDKMQGKLDASAENYERGRAAAAPAQLETRNTIREIYRNAPPVPVVCSIPDDVAVLLENARQRANAAAAGQSGGAVPVPAAAAPQ